VNTGDSKALSFGELQRVFPVCPIRHHTRRDRLSPRADYVAHGKDLTSLGHRLLDPLPTPMKPRIPQPLALTQVQSVQNERFFGYNSLGPARFS
jgi:hypothetical protein